MQLGWHTTGQVADAGSVSLAVGGAAAIVGLSAALIATDPQNRCAVT